MATGYTYKVETGEVTSFTDFALDCISAFVRNEGNEPFSRKNLPTPIDVKGYLQSYKDEAADATYEFTAAMEMTETEATEAAQEAYERSVKERTATLKTFTEQNARYQAMIDKVVAWVPPTPLHVRMKDFMIEQLKSSMTSEDYLNKYYRNSLVCETGAEYLADRRKHAQKRLTRAAEKVGEQVKVVEDSNAWIKAAIDSIMKTGN
jgi:hypothetical protein